MNKLALGVCFGLLFQGTCFTQCNDLASSNFPRSQTDIIGALPSDQQSDKLRQLFFEARNSTKKPIRFTRLPPNVPNTSAVETAKDAEAVALRQNLDRQNCQKQISQSEVNPNLFQKRPPEMIMVSSPLVVTVGQELQPDGRTHILVERALSNSISKPTGPTMVGEVARLVG